MEVKESQTGTPQYGAATKVLMTFVVANFVVLTIVAASLSPGITYFLISVSGPLFDNDLISCR